MTDREGAPLGEAGAVVVAIDVVRGTVVETPLERGCQVWALNPKQLDRFRDRDAVAGAKDDRRDARVLADAARTAPSAFRPLAPTDPAPPRCASATAVTPSWPTT
jgi:hypothetical protein